MELHIIFWSLYSLISFAVSKWVYDTFVVEPSLKSIATFAILVIIASLCTFVQDPIYVEGIYATLLVANMFLMIVLYFHTDIKEYLEEDEIY